MKKITLLLFAIFSLTFSWQSMAQVTVGTGTYTNAYSAYPLGAFYGYSYAQSIYLASEINASGDITAITFEMADADAIPNSDDMIDLWIGHTTKVEFDTTSDWVDVSTLTQVMTSGTLTKSGTTITFTFNAPFTYNGTDNLIIALDASEPNYDTSGDMIVGTNVGANRTLRHISDSVNFDPEAPITGVLTNYIGNATFMGIAQACPSPSDLTATNIMTTSADLSWTAGGTETLWNVEIVDVTAGGTVTGTVTDSGVANPFLASGLTPDNSYEYYVQADCGGDTSAWVGPFSFSTLPTCAEPSSLTITNITTTSADLSWTVGGTETSWNIELVDVTAGGTVTGTATSTGITNPYTLSGLTAGNQYEYYVQADCGGGDTSTWVGPYTFTTLCNPITSYPWSEDFESVSTPDLPSCWSHINNNGDTDNWRTYTTYGVGGSTTAGLYTDFNSGNNDDYLVLPQFTLTGNERLKFSVRARSSSEPNDYRVVLSTSGSTPTDFTEELLPLTQVSSTTQTEIAPIDLSSYTGDVYIAIHVPSGGLDGYYIYFDEFVVEPIPSCVEPSDLTATNIMTTSADLGWTENGSASSYNVEVVETGNTPTGTATDTGVANGFTKSGLLPSVTYDYYVQADCTGGDVSTWVGPYTFTTLCEPFTASYTQNFDAESTPDINVCWSTILENPTTTYANIITSTTESVSASNSVRFYNSSDSTSDFYLVSPNFSDLDNTKRVVFQLYQNQGTSDDGDVVEVGTMTDPSDASTYTTFQTITYEERTEDSWTNIVVNFDTYAGTDNYVAIKINFGGTYNYYYIDNFVYEEIPSCLEPSDLTATNIMATSADLGWTENGTASTYNVEVVLAGDAATGSATDTAVANGFTKSGLTDNTDYEFYVQAICGGDTSVWSGPYAFTTLCAAIVPNYIADFSTVAPSCWSEGNNTDVATGPDGNNGAWTNDDFLNTVGIEAAKINLYSNTQQDWLVSPVFDFSSGGYGLVFDVGVTAWNSIDAETPNLMGSDDEVLLLISEDNGATWTTLEAFNVENAPSHTGDNKIYDLSTITSSTVKFAFWATEGSVDDAEDIDFFVANFNVDLYTTLGVAKVEDEATFTYYPNPVNNNLTLSAQKEINNVSVYNMVGQEVFRNVPNAMTEVVDMSSLQAGAYFVKVTIGNATKTVKVIKN